MQKARWRFTLALCAVAARAAASDHRDAPIIDEDATVDLSDLFAFSAPGEPGRVVLALTANPFTIPGVNAFFSPSGLYEFKIDNTGDAVEDLVLQATFEGIGRAQKLELRGPARPRKTGLEPRLLEGKPAASGPCGEVLHAGGMKVFAGLRDDPFFFDQQAFFVHQKLRSPGVDFYAGNNVSALVVELPLRQLLGKGSVLKVWATGSRLVGGGYHQQDRVALPAVNVVLVPGPLRDDYNLAVPKDDLKRHGAALRKTLEALGIGDAKVRDALGGALLPDVLTLDTARPSGFLNGRRPQDDVIDAVLGLLQANKAVVPTDEAGKPSDHVDGNDVPFAPLFPYLAEPHEAE